MITRSWKAASLADLPLIAKELLEFTEEKKLFLLHGSLGAGKTTFVKACCEILGVRDTVNSPTFSIAQEYLCSTGDIIYHLDLYRVKNSQELFDLGFENYTDSGHYCFIEWPEKAEGLLNQTKADIFITPENDYRMIVCSYE